MALLPANALDRVKLLTADNRKTNFLTMDDYVAVIDSTHAIGARDMLLIAGPTGLCPSNLRPLTVAEADANVLRIPPARMKNGRRRMATI